MMFKVGDIVRRYKTGHWGANGMSINTDYEVIGVLPNGLYALKDYLMLVPEDYLTKSGVSSDPVAREKGLLYQAIEDLITDSDGARCPLDKAEALRLLKTFVDSLRYDESTKDITVGTGQTLAKIMYKDYYAPERQIPLVVIPDDPEICGPCDCTVMLNEVSVGHICAYHDSEEDHWYWTARGEGIPSINTLINRKGYPATYLGFEAAEAECLSYIRFHLERRRQGAST